MARKNFEFIGIVLILIFCGIRIFADTIYKKLMRPYKMKHLLLTIALLFSTPAWADNNSDQICPISYEVFEDEVSHIDLAECPDNKPDSDTGFCRMVFDGDEAFIYTFVYTQDDACLSAIIRADKSQYLIRR